MQDYRHDPFMPGDRQTNPIGLVGFILAFCVSPVGFLLSIVGLFFRPRGFAIAGAVIGAFGTALWAVIAVAVVAVVQLAKSFSGVGGDMMAIRSEIEKYQLAHDGAYPPSLNDLTLAEEAKRDSWGQEYAYEVTHDGKNFKVISRGTDKQLGTTDDLVMDRYLPPEAMGLMQGADFVGMFVRNVDFAGYTKTLQQMVRAEEALKSYREEHNEYPANLCDIVGLCDGPELLDGWGRPFHYNLGQTGRGYQIVSDGEDGSPDTKDDVNSDNVDLDFDQNWVDIETTP